MAAALPQGQTRTLTFPIVEGTSHTVDASGRCVLEEVKGLDGKWKIELSSFQYVHKAAIKDAIENHRLTSNFFTGMIPYAIVRFPISSYELHGVEGNTKEKNVQYLTRDYFVYFNSSTKEVNHFSTDKKKMAENEEGKRLSIVYKEYLASHSEPENNDTLISD
ncbi:MAG: hypothetical protein ACPGUD_01435 [Parashewanella sp.]